MCSSCHAHVLADAMLKDSTAACPSCRIDLARQLCSRNLAVEKAVAELLTRCLACDQELPRHEVTEHQRRHCCERYVSSCRVLNWLVCVWLPRVGVALIECVTASVKLLVVTGKDRGTN